MVVVQVVLLVEVVVLEVIELLVMVQVHFEAAH